MLRGQAATVEQTPVYGGRVSVREGASTVIGADGGFIIRGVAPGTQWVNVQAIGRAPAAQAVDLRPGDTAWLAVTLGPLPVTLAPVRSDAPVDSHPAKYEGRIAGDRLALTVTLTDTHDDVGMFSLRRDVAPRLHKCM